MPTACQGEHELPRSVPGRAVRGADSRGRIHEIALVALPSLKEQCTEQR